MYIHIHCIIDAAGRQDIGAEFIRHFRIENISGFLVSLKSVAIQYFGPDIAIIAGRIAACHRMGEIRRAVTRRNLAHQPAVGQHLGFESLHVELSRDFFEHMVIHIQQGSCQVFHRSKTLSVFAGFHDFIHNSLRNYLSGLIMFRVHFQHFRFERPMLHYLRRQFHKIDGYIRYAFVMNIGEKTV